MWKGILKRQLPLGLSQAWSFSGKANTHSLFWKLPWDRSIRRGLAQGLRGPLAHSGRFYFKPVTLVPLVRSPVPLPYITFAGVGSPGTQEEGASEAAASGLMGQAVRLAALWEQISLLPGIHS